MKWEQMIKERSKEKWGSRFVWWVHRAEAEHRIRELKEECADIMRRWDSDKRIFCGALQLLKEAGLSLGSSELIAAAERFDMPNGKFGEPSP